MVQGHILTLCETLLSLHSSLDPHILFLFLVFSLSSFLFLWYNSSSKGSRIRTNHSTPHSNPSSIKGSSDPVHDMFSVLKNPTTTPTTDATTYFTPTTDVSRPDPVPIPPRGLPLSLVNEQSRAVWVPQPYDAFLVLDVEATCLPGTDFHWPNEIIVRYRVEMCSYNSVKVQEWPVCLLKWVDKGVNGMAGTLQKVAEFRSFVKPTWRPKLSPFCTSLTGITQVSHSHSIVVVTAI
jgi:hypothetical protein